MNQSAQLNFYLGLDISKDKIDCALLYEESDKYQYRHKVITNDGQGFSLLLEWLDRYHVQTKQLHCCCEATNVYYLSAARFLNAAGIKISVVNPKIIKNYAEFKLKRIKTDKQDAKLIAQYCANENPVLWQPESEEAVQLKSLYRRAEQLNNLLTMEKNRKQVSDKYTETSINTVIEVLNHELDNCRNQMQSLIDSSQDLKHKQQLLETIVGVGRTTSQVLLAVLIDIDRFKTAKHLISWLGLSPVIRQSGKFKGLSRLSKMGDKSIRRALYMPARAACTKSKLWRGWFEEKLKTKPPKKVYVLMMVKIVKYAYVCIKNNTPFDPLKHKADFKI